jgi:hypothetical protein
VSNCLALSRFYRVEEPVNIMAQESQRPGSSQYIRLSASEWTAYTISSDDRKPWAITARVRAESLPAEVSLLINGQPFDLQIMEKDWLERKLGAVPLKRGVNELKWKITRGTVDLDWFAVEPTDSQEKAARAESAGGGP